MTIQTHSDGTARNVIDCNETRQLFAWPRPRPMHNSGVPPLQLCSAPSAKDCCRCSDDMTCSPEVNASENLDAGSCLGGPETKTHSPVADRQQASEHRAGPEEHPVATDSFPFVGLPSFSFMICSFSSNTFMFVARHRTFASRTGRRIPSTISCHSKQWMSVPFCSRAFRNESMICGTLL